MTSIYAPYLGTRKRQLQRADRGLQRGGLPPSCHCWHEVLKHCSLGVSPYLVSVALSRPKDYSLNGLVSQVTLPFRCPDFPPPLFQAQPSLALSYVPKKEGALL